MKLYEIASELTDFIDAVERGEIPEEAISDTLESLNMAFEDKADNIASLIKNTLAEAEAIKAEETMLKGRREAKERKAEYLKRYLEVSMQKTGMIRFESARNLLSFRKSEAVMIDDDVDFKKWASEGHDEYLSFKAPEINKTAIKAAIKDGKEVLGARIITRQNLQIK